MDNMYKILASIQDKKTPAALISVIDTKGSTPRAVGAKMIVLSDGTVHGSIGGSAVEALIIQEAMECISSGSYKKVMHNLNDLEKHDTGMICGGMMEFFIEPINLTPQLFIFGGGHCGYPLARIAHQVGFQYTIIEDRTEYAKVTRRDRLDFRSILFSINDDVFSKLNSGIPGFIIQYPPKIRIGILFV